MVMKIVGLAGSPRKNGNTDTLLQKVAQGAKTQGAETTLFYLNDLNIRGCQACYACKKTGKCAVNDDMTGIYRAIDEANAVIFGSPIYFGRFTAQLAPAMDRLFAYLRPDFTSSLAKGKKYGLVFTYNQPDPALYSACITSMMQVLGRLGFEAGPKPLVGAGFGASDAEIKKEQYLQAAFVLGKELASRQGF
jgi:multimeric flavodoxin WrbA